MIKGVIFDLDNTLVDFMAMKEAAVDSAVSAMIDAGLKMDKNIAKQKIFEIYKEVGIEDQTVFDKFLTREFGYIDSRIHAAGIVGYRRAREATLVLYPHAYITLIELLKRGLRLAVVTDAPKLQAWLRLCQLNLHHLFDVVVTFEDTYKRKPDPAPFKVTLERLKIDPGEAIMVGDWAERDIVGAKVLGMKTVFARYGDTFGTKNSGADYEIDDIIQLLDIIETLTEEKDK
ncbi:MAG: HAD-IA family hydrolase [candidate division WOR-3 bacterium]